MSENNIQALLKQGIELAREGNKAEARKLFEQVVELDDQNEKGWFWLASVMESDEEKRICLSNVLLINPGNERAQKLMEQLEARAKKTKADEEVIPGVTRRQLLMFAGGGAVVVLLAIVALVSAVSNQRAQEAAATVSARQTSESFTAVAVQATADSISATETQVAIASPTPTITNTPERATLPPEFTSTPIPTATPSPEPLPPATGLSGSIIAASSLDLGQTGYYPLQVIPLDGGQPRTLGSVEVRDPVLSTDGQRIGYTQYFATTFDFGVGQMAANGSDEVILTQGLAILQAQMPSYCSSADGSTLVAFVGLPIGEREIDFSGSVSKPYQVFTLNLATQELRRLTNDDATYTYPALSADCARIAAVRNDERGANPGADIVLIDTLLLSMTPITNDLSGFTETHLRWSPDGSELVYAAAQTGDERNHDIVARPPNPNATPRVLVRSSYDDIRPVFSPDGRYLAFASDRNGHYDILVLDLSDNTLYQLTSGREQDFPGGWAP